MTQAEQESFGVFARLELFLVDLNNDRLEVIEIVDHFNFVATWAWDLNLEASARVDKARVDTSVYHHLSMGELQHLLSLGYTTIEDT